MDKITKKSGKMAYIVLATLAIFGLCGQAMAASLKWADEWKIQEVTGATLKSGDANNALTTGVFYGPVAELKNSAGKSMLSFGGAVASLKVSNEGNISGVVGITPLTAFDNMFQFSVVGQISDFRLSDPDSYMLFISADAIKTGGWLYGKGASLVGALLP